LGIGVAVGVTVVVAATVGVVVLLTALRNAFSGFGNIAG